MNATKTLYIIRHDCRGRWTVRAADNRTVGRGGPDGVMDVRRQECQERYESDALAIARAEELANQYTQIAG